MSCGNCFHTLSAISNMCYHLVGGACRSTAGSHRSSRHLRDLVLILILLVCWGACNEILVTQNMVINVTGPAADGSLSQVLRFTLVSEEKYVSRNVLHCKLKISQKCFSYTCPESPGCGLLLVSFPNKFPSAVNVHFFLKEGWGAVCRHLK